MAKNAIFFVANFLPISPFALTFKGRLSEKLLLGITLCHECTVMQSCGKVSNKIYLGVKNEMVFLDF